MVVKVSVIYLDIDQWLFMWAPAIGCIMYY